MKLQSVLNKSPWCSGYHVCLTRRRSPKDSFQGNSSVADSGIFSFPFFLLLLYCLVFSRVSHAFLGLTEPSQLRILSYIYVCLCAFVFSRMCSCYWWLQTSHQLIKNKIRVSTAPAHIFIFYKCSTVPKLNVTQGLSGN